jgi:hypothetical protein
MINNKKEKNTMLTYTFKTTRPDTSAPFFTDCPTNAKLVNGWSDISDTFNIAPVRTISDDGLVSSVVYTFNSLEDSLDYTEYLHENLPEWFTARDAYYALHNHSLIVTLLNHVGETSVRYSI